MKRFLLIISFFVIFFSVAKPSFAEGIITDKKLITVDLGKQMLYAWDGGQIQYQSLVSSGMRYTPTLKGSFSVKRKVPIQDMKGQYAPYPPYHIKDVKHVLYYSGAYAIHGAHWHNRFGTRVSHGCVNLPPHAAEWVYNWADIGTPIMIF
ncbi:MAG TPA: L,D-transpeptidase [Candidatus Levybacteria bacterium]|nr:L,D-transpeptidase [Candidatus Levybacteria bacterium]